MFRKYFWQLLGTILAIGAIFATYDVFYRTRPSKALNVVLQPPVSLVEIRPEVAADIEIRYKGHSVPNASVLQVRIENAGNQPISKDDYFRPLSFSFPAEHELADVAVASSDPSNLGMQVTKSGKAQAEVSRTLLNPQDSALLRFITISSSKKSVLDLDRFAVDGRIEGVKEINKVVTATAPAKTDTQWLSGWGALAAVLGASLSALSSVIVEFLTRWRRRRLGAGGQKMSQQQLTPRKYEEPKPEKAEPAISQLINDTEKSVAEDLQRGDFEAAETKWTTLLTNFPEEFQIVDKVFSFYIQQQRIKNALNLLLGLENRFYDLSEFHRLVAIAYMKLKGKGIDEEAKNHALKAAQKCVEIDGQNPRWHILLGYVYYWFGEVKPAIPATEKALPLSESAHDENSIIVSKNNLAFYYALAKQKKDKAFEYANDGIAFYTPNSDKKNLALSYDTLGFVQWKFSTTKDNLIEARSNFLKAIELDPEEEGYLEHLRSVQIEINK